MCIIVSNILVCEMHNDAHLLFPHSAMQAMSNQQVTALATEQISLIHLFSEPERKN